MKIGQMAHYIDFVDGEITKTLLLQLVSQTKTEMRFKINTGNADHLTITKTSFPVMEWESGEKGEIKRKRIIEPF